MNTNTNKDTDTNTDINIDKKVQKKQKYSNEKIMCKCGAIVSRSNITHHNKTQKHVNNLKLIEGGTLKMTLNK